MAKTRGQITIDGRTFGSKEKLRDFVREILYRVPLEQPVPESDFRFLLALLGRHSRADHKIGRGVETIFTRITPRFPKNRGFWLRRLDGSETDWSFVECLCVTPHRTRVLNACRREVADQVIAFKKAEIARGFPSFTCPITGDICETMDGDLDHCSPDTFLALVGRFIAEEGLAIEAIEVNSYGDGEISDRFKDQAIARQWANFHRLHARLRLISKRANRSDLRIGETKATRHALL